MVRPTFRDVGATIALQPWAVFLAWVVVAGSVFAPAGGAVPVDLDRREIEVFTRTGCPHCQAAERFLIALEDEDPQLRISWRAIDRDGDALQRLTHLASQQGIEVLGVPAFYLRGQLIIGFVSEATTGARIRALLLAGQVGAQSPNGQTCVLTAIGPCEGAEDVTRLSLPFLGPLAVRDVGLPLFTVLIGLIDGFNPCAMWVLLFLLSLLVNVRDRRRMLLIAGTFVVASGLVYFAFMAAWLNVFMLIGVSAPVRVVLGTLAMFVGLVNVKDFVAFGRGISFHIPAAAKPRIYARARRILQAEDLGAAVASVIVLALLANTVELLCTAGFPAIYTHLLMQRELSAPQYYGYLLLYNAAYMLDDATMVVIAVVTLSRFKLQERAGRWLKLIGGVALLALGLALLFAPEWLSF